MTSLYQRVRIIDSHTGGEPTRVVVAGGPDLGAGSAAERLKVFRQRFDRYRTAILSEPRGSDVLVGALLLPPSGPGCRAGVIFFNNAGYLGMCGHGTIGVVATLAYLGDVRSGQHRIETPVGEVTARLHAGGDISVTNVPAYRHAKAVTVTVEGHGPVTGDVAWGGNWFFLVSGHGQELSRCRVDELTDFTWRVRQSLAREGVTGADGAEIDHIELFGPPRDRRSDSLNFVLCPGKTYDRSPCGTGTSAKLACMYADGEIAEGQIWRQAGILGSVFQGAVNVVNGQLVPTIRGRAYITSDSTLLLDSGDPFCWGIR